MLEPRGYPVGIKGHYFRHLRSIDKASVVVLFRTTSPDNPVTNLGKASDVRFACGKSAKSTKWIGGKAVISRNNIRE